MRSSPRELSTPTLSPRPITSRTWASWRPSSRCLSVLKGLCSCPRLLMMGQPFCFVCDSRCADGIAPLYIVQGCQLVAAAQVYFLHSQDMLRLSLQTVSQRE